MRVITITICSVLIGMDIALSALLPMWLGLLIFVVLFLSVAFLLREIWREQ